MKRSTLGRAIGVLLLGIPILGGLVVVCYPWIGMWLRDWVRVLGVYTSGIFAAALAIFAYYQWQIAGLSYKPSLQVMDYRGGERPSDSTIPASDELAFEIDLLNVGKGAATDIWLVTQTAFPNDVDIGPEAREMRLQRRDTGSRRQSTNRLTSNDGVVTFEVPQIIADTSIGWRTLGALTDDALTDRTDVIRVTATVRYSGAVGGEQTVPVFDYVFPVADDERVSLETALAENKPEHGRLYDDYVFHDQYMPDPFDTSHVVDFSQQYDTRKWD